MMRLPGLAVGALALALAVAACDQPVPPLVALREPSLDARDLGVIAALLDARFRSGQTDTKRPRLLLIDTTVAVCAADPVVFSPPPGGCLDRQWIRLVSEALPPTSRRTATLAFEARNARRLPIPGPPGAEVTFISATLADSLSAPVLLADHPPGSQVVTFSAPVYPSSRVAALAYRAVDAHRAVAEGAARLELRMNGRWSVVATAGPRPQE